MSTTYEFRLIRAERLQLAAAALRGILSGAIRAVVFLAPGSAPPPAPVMGSSSPPIAAGGLALLNPA